MKRNLVLAVLTISLTVAAVCSIGRVSAQRKLAPGTERSGATRPETTTPQTLPFSQNWTNAGLITTNDDWAGVPGIVGYRGDDLVTATDTDLRTIVADGALTPIDVNANQTSPDTFVSGGVSEFDTITNPTVALQGSGTADLPHLVIYLNTTGQSGIHFVCNVRDIDGSADNSTQQFNVQYRVGGTGDYVNVTGGYIADASTGPSLATLVSPLNLTLPANADNQALVEIRLMTTNAIGNDEWLGVDDISVTAGGGGIVHDAPSDFNGDGKTDFAVVRNAGGPTGQLTWHVLNNGGGIADQVAWGLATDTITPGDFDGDGKDDVAVWRPGSGNSSGFFIFQSGTGTFRFDQLGTNGIGDDPSIVTDYDGDGKDDPAIYRPGASNTQSTFWFIPSGGPNAGVQTPVSWGLGSDDPLPGDFNGDGKADFAVRRSVNCGAPLQSCGVYYIHPGTGGSDAPGANTTTYFGLGTDLIVPGDYDGDGKTDIAIVRVAGTGGLMQWYALGSAGTLLQRQFGLVTDDPVQGDYDGDGLIDIAVWRANSDSSQNYFIWDGAVSGLGQIEWGQCPFGNCDVPVASDNTHGL